MEIITTVVFVLMAAPSVTDDHVMNYAIPLGIYKEAEECSVTALWINEHAQNLPRHLWCMPVGIIQGEPV